jgi:hypothetical protein
MGSLSFVILSSKNEGLAMSPSYLLNNFLFGIPLCTTDGRELSLETVKQKIIAAQKQMEGFLQLKLNKQIVIEDRDWHANEFSNWGFIKTSYPVNTPYELKGFLNEVPQVEYPKEWLSVKKINNNDPVFRNIHLIPNSGLNGGATMNNNAFVYSGSVTLLGYLGANYIPNYWKCRYCTGWTDIPADISQAIAHLATVQLLAMIGDYLLGVGVTSSSLSLDGISQSISNTKSSQGGLFAGRIKQTLEELKNELSDLKGIYRGMIFESM